jgi:hypothetical protein
LEKEITIVGFSPDFDLTTFRDKVQSLVDTTYPCQKDSSGCVGYNWIQKLTPAYVIYNYQGDTFQINLTISTDQSVTLGDRTKVIMVPVAAESKTVKVSESATLTLDKKSPKGYRWNVTILSQGLTKSANANLASYGYPDKYAKKDYTAESILDAGERKVFDGAPVILRSVADHLATANGGGSQLKPNDEAKKIAANINGTFAAEGSVKGFLDIRKTESGERLRTFLMDRAALNPDNPFDLSWTGEMDCTLLAAESADPVLKVTKILEAISVDPVPVGNAGGKVRTAAESILPKKTMNEKQLKMLRAKLIAFCAEADVEGADEATAGSAAPTTLLDYAAKFIYDNLPGAKSFAESVEDIKAQDEAKILLQFDEAMKAKSGGATTEPTAEEKAAEAARKKAAEASGAEALLEVQNTLNQVRMESAESQINLKLAQSNDLPLATRDKIKALLSARMKSTGKPVSEGEIDTEIRGARELAGTFVGNRDIFSGMGTLRVVDEQDKLKRHIDNFFSKDVAEGSNDKFKETFGYNPTERQYARWTSFRRMWQDIFGMSDVGHSLFTDSQGKVAEAFSTGTPSISTNILSDAIHRRLAADYKSLLEFDEWKKIANVISLTDFKAYNTQQLGYFDGLDDIAADGLFTEKTLSGNDNTSMTLGRKGNRFYITFEQLRNDDVGYVQSLPRRLAWASHRQCSKFMWDKLINGFAVSYSTQDANFMFSAAHGNIPTASGVAALGQTAVEAGRLAMAKYTELGGGERMGIRPKYLIYPVDLNSVAYKILKPAADEKNMVATVAQSFGLEGIEVPHWTDPLKWFMASDRNAIDGFTAGFLDGKEEPEIINEMPNTGSHYDQLRLSFRIHHVYAGTPGDWRQFYGAKQS